MKQLKLCKVVILAAEKASKVVVQNNQYFKPQHLYFTSDDEIKEGDWYYNESVNNIFRAELKSHSTPPKNKIIASTDPNITPDFLIPESFIKVYVDSYNSSNPITEVNLELSWFNYGVVDGGEDNYDLIVKTRPDNTVIVHSTKTYSRDEVVNLISDAITNFSSHDQWIKYNL